MRILQIFILLFSISAWLTGQPQEVSPLLPGRNFRIHPSTVTQSEVFITASPNDRNLLFSTCNTISFIPFFISEGIYVSSDGGAVWAGSDTCTGYPAGFHGGDPGIAIDRNGTFILTRLGRSPFVGLYSHYSSDNGKTWSDQQVISTDDLERAALATDAVAGSGYSGRTYAVWTKLSQPFALNFSSTDDGAKTWIKSRQVNNPTVRCAGGAVAVGVNGKVYACWAGVADTSPFIETGVGFASSSDGGSTWNVNENAFPVNGITGILPEKGSIRVNGLPTIATDTSNGARRGWIYIVTTQKDLPPAGSDPDVILYRSADEGLTWSSGIRVNQDPVNDGKIQYFPAIHIDKYGALDIIFYDDRATTSDSAGVFLARSTDGGNTWKEFRISDHNFKPAPIGGLGQGYQGDAIGITSTDTLLWPVWMDNSSGLYQVWGAPVNFYNVNGIEDPGSFNAGSDPGQNFPNPFHNKTTIPYRVTEKGYFRIDILDPRGSIITTPVSGIMTPGSYNIAVDLSEYGNLDGLLFYRLVERNIVKVMKMVRLVSTKY